MDSWGPLHPMGAVGGMPAGPMGVMMGHMGGMGQMGPHMGHMGQMGPHMSHMGQMGPHMGGMMGPGIAGVIPTHGGLVSGYMVPVPFPPAQLGHWVPAPRGQWVQDGFRGMLFQQW